MAHVTLNGSPFELKPDPPKFGRILQMMRVEKRGTEVDRATAYLDFLDAMLADDVDRSEFEAAICEMDADEIGAALKEAAETYRADPTSAGRTSSRLSAGGPSTGAATSRVVSFSKGTVETVPEPVSSTG
jgi:hypothetical protein